LRTIFYEKAFFCPQVATGKKEHALAAALGDGRLYWCAAAAAAAAVATTQPQRQHNTNPQQCNNTMQP
jgi:hypothetical protein